MDEGNFWVAPEWLELHNSGSSVMALVDLQSFGSIVNELCLSGKELVWVALQWPTGIELTEPALRRTWVTLHWTALDWTEPENLAEIEASDWSRARNAGFWLVQRTFWKCSKGVPLRSWTFATRTVLKLYTMNTSVSQIMLSLINSSGCSGTAVAQVVVHWVILRPVAWLAIN